MKELKVELYDILDIINCSEDYGFKHDVLMNFFAEVIGDLSSIQIEQYARSIGDMPGYGNEDYLEALRIISEFKEEYIINNQSLK